MSTTLSWTERLDLPVDGEIKPAPAGRKKLQAGQLIYFPNGRALDDAIRSIPRGTTSTLKELRAELAQQHGAAITCPVTAGIGLRIVVEAVRESLIGGASIAEVTPIWRLLDARSPVLKRVPLASEFVLEQRTREAAPAPGGE